MAEREYGDERGRVAPPILPSPSARISVGFLIVMQSSNVPHQPVNHVFVDLENVKCIDVAVVAGKNVTFHLFLGPHNKKLDVEVVEVLLENAQAVKMIRSPKAGKNALDFVLAYHLGQAVLGDPRGFYHLISKDAGFDSLVDLLKSRQVKVRRHENWSSLNLNGHPKPAVEVKALSEAAEKLAVDLKKMAANRPKRRKGLLGRVSSLLAKGSTEADCERVVEELVKAKQLSIDEKGVVSYPL